MNARQPHGGCWRRLAAGRLCGRYQSSTNTIDGVAGLSSGGSGRHGRSRHNLIGRVCRQLTRRLWPGSFGNRRCAFAVPFNEGLLPWFIGLPGQYERPRRSRGSLPAAWCHAQRTMGEAGSLWSIVLFVSLCFIPKRLCAHGTIEMCYSPPRSRSSSDRAARGARSYAKPGVSEID